MPKRLSHHRSRSVRKSSQVKKQNYFFGVFIAVVVILVVLVFQQRARDVKGVTAQTCKTGVSSFYIVSTCGTEKASEIGFSCYNGEAQTRSGECKNIDKWKTEARSFCRNASSCSLVVTPTITPSVRPSPTPKPTGFRQIDVKAICTYTSATQSYRQWLITNTNSNNVSFDYAVNGGFKYRTFVKAKSVLALQTTVENTRNKMDILRVYESDRLVDTDASSSKQCFYLTPTPRITLDPMRTPTPTPYRPWATPTPTYYLQLTPTPTPYL